jgi:hypothetical protein
MIRTVPRKRRRRPVTDYFVAVLGIALLAFIVAVVATSGSCHLRVSPEVGLQPASPRPTPAPTR